MMFEPKRIHPVGMILSFVNMIKSYIIPAIIFFFVSSNESFNLYIIIGGCLLILFVVVTSILEWWKFTYIIEDGELRIEHGIFVKKKRYIPIERIQTINISAGVIQQIFRLVKLQIETAGSGMEAEVSLTAIKKQEADRIQEEISKYKQLSKLSIGEDEQEEVLLDQPTFKMTTKDLLVAASTSSGIGVIISAVAAFVSQFDEFIPYDQIIDRFDFLTNASITLYAILIFIAFFIAWILSIIGVVLKYAYFTVIKGEEELKISRGIFEKRQITIPTKRIQAIQIVQNPLRQLLGYTTIYIESAGGNSGDEGLSTILFPVVPKKNVEQLLLEFLPDFKEHSDLHRLPKRSMIRYCFRKTIPALIVMIPVAYFLQPWGYVSIILLPVAAWWGFASYKDAGWNYHGDQLNIVFRIISKTHVLVNRNRLQSVKSKTTYFQKRASLETFECTIKSGLLGRNFTVKDLDQQDVEKIINWYSYEKSK
ncbi:PH domain-containing protein [Metabacillus halosaccharovorans]|uniref:PH domain-containing protein n=1 Tax=Metabacillus halosaccharovorans TaxID=930124 RepID=UPI001C1F6997|nr:PH domain-containing protein [Metabacillus halosaccharovorans]MBU7596020.1 PH domain-containing protein [Metabacillus halosaccharovorans]